jgi:hypothetical protein
MLIHPLYSKYNPALSTYAGMQPGFLRLSFAAGAGKLLQANQKME